MTDTTPSWRPGPPATTGPADPAGGLPATPAHIAFRQARDLLLTLRENYDEARDRFRWPDPGEFNWARDWFDHVAADPVTGARTALWLVDPAGVEDDVRVTYAAMADRSRRVAGWLAGLGVMRGDRVLVMLDNQVELWETLLACMRLGAAVIPAATQLAAADLRDRIERGAARFVVARSEDTEKFTDYLGGWTPIAVGAPVVGWHDYAATAQAVPLARTARTEAEDTLLLYFTSGTTARPKLVEHTHASYPIGSLSTMYWIGLRPGDVHLNLASPGWAKHAWSTLFAPWNAEATIVAVRTQRVDPERLLAILQRCGVTTFCALPTVWRMLGEADLEAWAGRLALRELVAAGERLSSVVAERVHRAWGLPVREGFGQTETTAQVANTPGQPVVAGSMGRPLPGYDVAVLDPITGEEVPDDHEGELCLRLAPRDSQGTPLGRPAGLMVGYRNDESRTAQTMYHGYYHTGDVARRDARGYLTHIGRTDEVFKANDARISPFEVESVLVSHPAVAEAAVVPSPDPRYGSVPKAFVTLVEGEPATEQTALEILRFAGERLSAHNRVTRLEFGALPKTLAGKIRRVTLREQEARRRAESAHAVGPSEFWVEDPDADPATGDR